MKTSFSGEEHGGFITTDEPVKTDLTTVPPYAPPSPDAQRSGSPPSRRLASYRDRGCAVSAPALRTSSIAINDQLTIGGCSN